MAAMVEVGGAVISLGSCSDGDKAYPVAAFMGRQIAGTFVIDFSVESIGYSDIELGTLFR